MGGKLYFSARKHFLKLTPDWVTSSGPRIISLTGPSPDILRLLKLLNQQIRVLLVAPPLQVVGGQSIQASRLVSCLSEYPQLEVTYQPTTTTRRWFQNTFGRIRFIRTFLNALIYVPSLMVRIPRNDVIHVFTAGHASF